MNALLVLRFAILDIWYDWRRSLLSMVKLAVMVTTYLLVAILGQALQAFSSGSVTSANNLLIVSADIFDPMDSSLMPNLPQEAAHAVQAQFGDSAVLTSAPVYFFELQVDGQMLQVYATPGELFEPVFQLDLVEGRWPQHPGEIAAARGAARKEGWRPGAKMTIYGTPFEITGIFDTDGRGAASLWMTFPAGEQLFGTARGVQIGVLQINPQADLAAIQAWLEDALPTLTSAVSPTGALGTPEYAVYQESQLNESLNQAIRGAQPLGVLFQALALLVLTFGGFNVASLTLQERQAEVSILRQIHFTEWAIQGFIASRGILLSLAAFLPGWITAWLVRQPFETGAIIYGAYLDFTLSADTTWLGLGLVLVSTTLGAWLASRSSQKAL